MTLLSYLKILVLPMVILFILLLIILLFILKFKEFKRLKEVPFSFLMPLHYYFKTNRSFLLYALLILNLFGIFIIIYHDIIFPPKGWDAYLYHLPVVARIVQDKGFEIYNVPSFMHPHFNIFPKNAELLFAYNFLFLKTDQFIEIVQVPFILFSILSIYSISRYLKISQKNSLWALIFTFIPIVFQQSVTCYVDLILSSFVIMSINFLIKRKPIYLLFSIISASLALGTKGTGIPFFVIVIGFTIFLYSKEIFNRKRILKYLFLLVLFSLPLGGHFYIRNILLFKSPLGDAEISIGKMKIKKGKWKIETEGGYIFNSIFEIPPQKERHFSFYTYIYDTRAGGFGPLFAIFYFPALFFGLIMGILKKNKGIIILFFILIFIYLSFPYKWWTRFHIYFAGISIVFFSYIIEEFPEFFYKIPLTILIFSFIASARGILSFSIQKYLPYKYRRLYFFETNKQVKDLINPFIAKIEKNDIILFYYSPKVSTTYTVLIALSYRFMLPDYSTYHRYIFSLKDKRLKKAKWVITPTYIESISENYMLIYKNKNLKIWKRK